MARWSKPLLVVSASAAVVAAISSALFISTADAATAAQIKVLSGSAIETAMAVLIALLSTNPINSTMHSGLNLSSATVVCDSAIFARRLLMTQLATDLGFFDCQAIASK